MISYKGAKAAKQAITPSQVPKTDTQPCVVVIPAKVMPNREIKPRSHQLASAAYKRVEAHKSSASAKKYGAIAHKLPALILQNGLAQATGFLLAKGKEEHLALLDDLAQVLREVGETGCVDRAAMHATIIAADVSQTMHLTRRSLEVSGWLKRYVQGVLNVDATGAGVENV